MPIRRSLDAVKETLKTFGSELKAVYLTMGGYGIVAISEAPDDTAAAKVALAIGAAGNVTTDIYELIVERHRSAVTVVTSNREPVEWLGLD